MSMRRCLPRCWRAEVLKSDFRTQKEDQSYAEVAEETKTISGFSFRDFCKTFATSASGSPLPSSNYPRKPVFAVPSGSRDTSASNSANWRAAASTSAWPPAAVAAAALPAAPSAL
jgi:hypothetical protein